MVLEQHGITFSMVYFNVNGDPINASSFLRTFQNCVRNKQRQRRRRRHERALAWIALETKESPICEDVNRSIVDFL